MGLPFLKMAAEMTGGGLSITSQPGRGTRVCAQFGLHHIDRAPLGDMASTIAGLIQCSPDIDFVYTREMRAVLGGVPLSEPSVAQWIREFIEENTQPILEGVI